MIPGLPEGMRVKSLRRQVMQYGNILYTDGPWLAELESIPEGEISDTERLDWLIRQVIASECLNLDKTRNLSVVITREAIDTAIRAEKERK